MRQTAAATQEDVGLETGKVMKINGWGDAGAAKRVIAEAIARRRGITAFDRQNVGRRR